MYYRRYVILVVFLTLVLLHKNLGAQDFEVAPVKLEFNAEPGENQTKTITVRNHSNKKESFLIVMSDFLPSSSGAINYLAPNSTKRSCANWLNINPSFFELNPNDEIPIQISMMVPNDQYSAAWCVIYIQSAQEQSSWNAEKNLGTGMIVTGRIGLLIYQSPKSNTNHSLKISNLVEVTKLGDKERVFSATIENLGEKITKSKAYLIASNMKTAEEKQLPPSEFEVFPKLSRTIELRLPNLLVPGSYSLAAILDYGTKYSLEGTQIIIEVKEQTNIVKPDTIIVKSDTLKVK
ncbi:MAG: hypothetical protein HOO91_17475 [Bacteroidales bacterium]|nr:hypothetical protein [Bacteroidales bacterium]